MKSIEGENLDHYQDEMTKLIEQLLRDNLYLVSFDTGFRSSI